MTSPVEGITLLGTLLSGTLPGTSGMVYARQSSSPNALYSGVVIEYVAISLHPPLQFDAYLP